MTRRSRRLARFPDCSSPSFLIDSSSLIWSFDIFSLRGEALGEPPQGGRSFFAEPYWG